MPLQSIVARAARRFMFLVVAAVATPFSPLHSQTLPLHVREELPVARSGDARVPVNAVSFSVASDGSDFLLAWNSGSTTRIARVTAEGVLLDPGGFAIGARTEAAPKLVWGGESYFLFTVENRELLLRRISRRGDLLDSVPLVISPNDDPVPATIIGLASNGDGALVIIKRTNREGLRVGRRGEVGPRFTIARGASPIAVASTGLSYQVAWFNLVGNGIDFDLRSATVTGEGAFLDGTVATLHTTSQQPLELTAGSIGAGLVLAWGERVPGAAQETEIKARVPSAFGSTLFSVATGLFSKLRVTAAEGPGAFLLWSGRTATREDLFRASLTSGAAPVIEATARSGFDIRGEVATSLASHLIIRSDRGVLSASIVTDAGMSRPVPAQGLFVTAAASQSNPAVTGGDDVAAIAWNEGDGRIVFGRIDARGTALDPAAIVVAPPDSGAPSLSFDGDSYLVCWERYNRERGKSELHGRMLSRRGALLGDPFLVADLASRPVAIWSGIHHFVFVERRSGEAGFVRVSKAGVVADPAIRPLAKPIDGYQRSFSVACSPQGCSSHGRRASISVMAAPFCALRVPGFTAQGFRPMAPSSIREGFSFPGAPFPSTRSHSGTGRRSSSSGRTSGPFPGWRCSLQSSLPMGGRSRSGAKRTAGRLRRVSIPIRRGPSRPGRTSKGASSSSGWRGRHPPRSTMSIPIFSSRERLLTDD